MAKTTKPKVPKLDLRKRYRDLYLPSAKKVTVVDVPELLFVMVDGAIEAGASPEDSASFRQTLEAMYGVAYGLKFMSKLREENPIDFTVMALEGLWTTDSLDSDRTEPWPYTMLMLHPDHITQEMFTEAVAQADAKRPNPALSKMRLERWCEGLSIQMMHIGPYSEEERTIREMHEFAAENGYQLRGRHHEIYLGDPRRAKPENLKTVLRHPVTAG